MSDTTTTAVMWEALVGQEHAVTLMRRAAERPVHAYLLVGSKGADLVAAARRFAAALVVGDASPTESDRAVELALKGAHPDVVEIEPEATTMTIRQAREEIVPEAWRSPVEPGSARKVLVLYEAERLQPEAENALLKTFEEPPPTTVIVLVTSAPDELLETTRSRCQRIELAPLDEATVARVLEAEGHPPDAAALAARLAGGQLGRARALVEDRRALRDTFVDAAGRVDGTGAAAALLAEELDGAVHDALAALRAHQEEEVVAFDAAAARAGYLPRDIARVRNRMLVRHKRHERIARREALVEGVTALETVYRDALAGEGAPRRNLDRTPLAVEARAAVRALDACREARQSLEHNPNEGLLLERLLLHLPATGARRPG